MTTSPAPGRSPTADRGAAHKQALGAYGEDLAARLLVESGLSLLDRNWRCDEGEIDLVLRDGDVLVVCEVKTRSSGRFGMPHEAVDARKLARLQRLAQRWREDHGIGAVEVRIDLVGVVRPRSAAPSVDHVRGIG